MKKMTMLLAAAGMAMAPVAANAAASLSVARAMAPMSGVSYFDDDEGTTNHGGGSTAVVIGVLLVVAIIFAAIGGNNDRPSNSP